jgi:Nucleotidyltransferase of unknown function (DUF6036)
VKDRMRAFLADLDQSLVRPASGRVLAVYHIGRSALVWEYDYAATTKDFDILRPAGEADLVDLAVRLFGWGTAKAAEHGLYLQVVEEALPPVPGGYERRATPVREPWQVLRVYHLDPHDLAATKLRRFEPKDREDIRQLCDLGLLDPTTLEEILEKAFRWNLEKDGDDYRDIPFRNLRTVQRYLRGEVGEF